MEMEEYEEAEMESELDERHEEVWLTTEWACKEESVDGTKEEKGREE